MRLERGEHSYYFTGKDEHGKEAGGPSAGEGNQATSPDVSKKKVEDTPGPAAVVVLLAMLVSLLVIELRRRR